MSNLIHITSKYATYQISISRLPKLCNLMENAIKFEFSGWPSDILVNQCCQICQGKLTGWHWLARNSEGHLRISKFLFLMVPYSYNRSLDTLGLEKSYFSSIWNKLQTLSITPRFFLYTRIYLHKSSRTSEVFWR